MRPLTLLLGLTSPTMSFPTILRNAGSSPNCKDNMQWFSSSAAEVSAPRIAGRLKGLLNSIVSSRLGYCRLVTISTDLRAVTKKCRADWDITTPELKAAWQQGRMELFYPYGKTYVQTLGEQD